MAASTLADEEPETAWRHARAARARGGRIGVVRETVGLVAYRAGEWAEAIGELRAARRMGGGPGHLAVLADCERALGHPEKAIELSRSAEADELDPEASIELSIVVAGARADLDQVDVALAQLERLGVDKAEAHPRLAYAYADLLLKAGRGQEALSWFIRSANADADEETDALDRVAELSDEASAESVGDSQPVADDLLDDEDLELSPGRQFDQFSADADSAADSDSTVAAANAAESVASVADDAENVDPPDNGSDQQGAAESNAPASDLVAEGGVSNGTGGKSSAGGDSAHESIAGEAPAGTGAAGDSAGNDSAGNDSAGNDSAGDNSADPIRPAEDNADGAETGHNAAGQDVSKQGDQTDSDQTVGVADVPPLLFSDDTQTGDR
ncbi:MAG: tetratricopeptide repeat protein [Nakamurella sp.]